MGRKKPLVLSAGEVVDDWADVYERLKGQFWVEVMMKRSGDRFHAFDAWRFSRVDHVGDYLQVSADKFEAAGPEIMSLALHYRFGFVIMEDEDPKLVLDPTDEAMEHVFEVIGLDEDEFRTLILSGRLVDLIGGNPDDIRRRRDRRIKQLKKEHREEIDTLTDSHKAQLRAIPSVIVRDDGPAEELRKLRDKIRNLQTILVGAMAHINYLRKFIPLDQPAPQVPAIEQEPGDAVRRSRIPEVPNIDAYNLDAVQRAIDENSIEPDSPAAPEKPAEVVKIAAAVKAPSRAAPAAPPKNRKKVAARVPIRKQKRTVAKAPLKKRGRAR